MIKGELKQQREHFEAPSVNYREIKALNQSMIIKYSESPAEFVEEFIMGKPKKKKSSSAMDMGNVIDDILFTCKGNMSMFNDMFSEKYTLFAEEKSTKQVFILADELFDITEREPDSSFSSRFAYALARVQGDGKYKGKTAEQVLKDFEENGADYFQLKLDNIGKTVISQFLLDKSVKIAQEAMDDEFMKDVLNFEEEDDEHQCLTKYPITFNYKSKEGEIEGKLELDKLRIDHRKKIIRPFDGKATYDNTMFPYNYIKNSYYIQQAWYTEGLIAWANENDMRDYSIFPFEFIVFDTSGNRRPLRYKLNEQHLLDGRKGFTVGSRKYDGIYPLVDDIIWSVKTNNWGMRKKDFLAKGVINLPKYE